MLEDFAGIIEAAGAGPLALIALFSLLLSSLAIRWFGKDHLGVRVGVFFALFLGVAGIVFALMNGLGVVGKANDGSDPPEPEEEPTELAAEGSTSPGAVNESETTLSDSPTRIRRVSERSSITGAERPASMPTPPPPSPPPLALPEEKICNAGPYIAFFEWNESAIPIIAKPTLVTAINAYKDCGEVIVQISGHTDKSIPADQAMELSEARTIEVMNYFVSNGIPTSQIRRHPFGNTQPRVETADGVRELQNRRVEVSFR